MSDIRLQGMVIVRDRETGRVLSVSPNMVVYTGRHEVIKYLGNSAPVSGFLYMAVGTSNTAPADSQTELGAQVGSRVSATFTDVSEPASYIAKGKWVATFNFTATYTLYEIGLFSAATGGVMLCRSVFSVPINVTNGTSIEFTYYITALSG